MYGIREEQGEDEEYNLKDGSLKNVSFTHSNSILVVWLFYLEKIPHGATSLFVDSKASPPTT